MAKRLRDEHVSRPSEAHSTSEVLPSPPLPTSPTSQRKHVLLDESVPLPEVIRCGLPLHKEPLSFSTYEDYEVHYMQSHVNRCSGCGKNFPSELFLTRHIEENHDPLSEAKRARGERTFGCFVEGCERRCSTPQKRRMHLIDKHAFPRTYNFWITNDGIDGYRSLLRSPPTRHRRVSLSTTTQHETRQHRRRSSEFPDSTPSAIPVPVQSSSTQPMTQPMINKAPHASSHLSSDTKQAVMDIDASQGVDAQDDVANLTKSMSALKFIPTSVMLRHDKGKTKASSNTTS